MAEDTLQYRIVNGVLAALGRLASRPVLRALWLLGLHAVLCVIVTFQFIRNYSNPMLPEELHQHSNAELPERHMSGLNAKSWAEFPDMVAGTAHKPYVNRVLMPLLIRGVARVLPDGRFNALALHPRYQLALEEIGLDWNRGHTEIYVVGVALMFLFLLGYVYAVRWLFVLVYESAAWLRDAVGVVALLVLPPCFELYGSYIYDFSGLCLFTVGLGLMVRERWGLFLVVYALATLNKETAVLLTFAFCMFHTFSGRMRWGAFFGLALAQSILFVAIKAGIGIAFADNPGGAVEFHLLRNLSKLPRWDLGAIAFAAVLLLLVGHAWREKSLFLRSSLIMLVPLVGLTFLFGYFDELRDYYEAFPSLLLLATHSVARILGVPLVVRA